MIESGHLGWTLLTPVPHAGTLEVDMMVNGAVKPAYFWGGKDLSLFLARLVPTFSNADHVWAIGTSAGGFATVLDHNQVTRAFAGVRVDIINDSGPVNRLEDRHRQCRAVQGVGRGAAGGVPDV